MDTERTEHTVNGDGYKDILAPGEEGPRENLINEAVKFLQHPKVSSAPSYQKKAFLEKKGLTSVEITSAFNRAGVVESQGQSTVAPVAQAPQALTHHGQPQYMLPVPPQSGWARARDLAMTTIIVSTLSYGAFQLFQKYLRPLILGKNETEKRLDRLESQLAEIHKSVADSLVEVNLTLSSIKNSLTTQQMTNHVDSRGVADLKADISSLKGLLLSRNQFPPAPSAAPVLPSWQRTPSASKLSTTPQDANGPPEPVATSSSSSYLAQTATQSDQTLVTEKSNSDVSLQAPSDISAQDFSRDSDAPALMDTQDTANNNPSLSDSC